MINRLTAMAVLTIAAIAIVACGAGPGATTTPSAVPTATSAAPTAAPAIAITTAPAANAMCMDALMTGKLARDVRTGLGVTASDGQQMAVEWPFGYSARADGGRLALVDETGEVVAREGDTIQVGGGFGNVMWHACGPVTVAL
jgi:hypothetical protein